MRRRIVRFGVTESTDGEREGTPCRGHGLCLDRIAPLLPLLFRPDLFGHGPLRFLGSYVCGLAGRGHQVDRAEILLLCFFSYRLLPDFQRTIPIGGLPRTSYHFAYPGQAPRVDP